MLELRLQAVEILPASRVVLGRQWTERQEEAIPPVGRREENSSRKGYANIMAFGLTAVDRVIMTLTFYDEATNSTPKRVHVDWDTDLGTTLGNAAAIADDYQLASDAQVMATVSIPLTDDAPATAAAGSEVENRAALVLNLVTDATHFQDTQTLEIPAPKIGMFTGTTGPAKNVVDVSDTLVTNLVAHYQETGGTASIGDGQKVMDTTPVASGKRVHKASRKG